VLTDARELAPGGALEAEICVVGAGPAGIALSRELEATGKSVVLLEAGGLGRHDAPKDLAVGESIGESYFPLHTTLVHGFGGTSNHWYVHEGFRTRPLDSIDFRERAAVPHSGWPISRQALERHYARAQDFLGFGGMSYEASDWGELLDDALLDLDPTRVKSVVFLVIPGHGVTHYLEEVRRASNVHLVYNAYAADLVESASEGHVTELVARVPGGAEVRVRADRYVLAAGGLGNPRILLQSRGRHPGGIGNHHDVVGRFFMEHIGLRGGRVEPVGGRLLEGAGNPYFSVDTGPVSVQTKLSLAPEVLESEGLLNSTFFLERMPRSRTTQAVRSFVVMRRAVTWRPLPRDLPSHAMKALAGIPSIFDTAMYEKTGRREADSIQLMAMAEQAPNPESRVTLSAKVNSLGLQRVKLDWRPTSQDTSSIIRSEAIIAEELHRSGIAEVRDPLSSANVKWQYSGQWHQLGTTRMGTDPEHSVVDAECRVHGVDNLWITGGSVFPTGGYANPTLTIIAMALRLGETLAPRHVAGASEGDEPEHDPDRQPTGG
jgi:choline dehydrogenase-like flavoprotein